MVEMESWDNSLYREYGLGSEWRKARRRRQKNLEDSNNLNGCAFLLFQIKLGVDPTKTNYAPASTAYIEPFYLASPPVWTGDCPRRISRIDFRNGQPLNIPRHAICIPWHSGVQIEKSKYIWSACTSINAYICLGNFMIWSLKAISTIRKNLKIKN